MAKYVANYNNRVCSRVVSDRFDGVATFSFYTKENEFPSNSEIYKEIVAKIEHTKQMVSRTGYNCDYMFYVEDEQFPSTAQCSSEFGGSDSGTTQYYRAYTMLWQCLGGVLKLVMESWSAHINGKYISATNGCSALFDDAAGKLQNTPVCQMDTFQGEVTQDSHIASNTVITRDKAEDVTEEQGISTVSLRQICSTEDELTFDSIVNRWMALDTIQVSINHAFNTMLKVYNLPKFLYTESFAPNLMPFQNFMYGNYVIEVRFVVNANKFHVGKLVCAVKYDSYQIDGIRNDVVSLLARPHIILDLSANNEGVLNVPFKYHRTYVRNASASSSNWGIKDAQFATINVAILSQLRAVAGAPTTVNIRPFYRIKQAQFTGMSYGVPVVQMEAALGALALEEGLKFVGSIVNKDKPIDLQRQAQYVPKPRMNFSTGKGASDVNPIKLDPSTLTTFLDDHHYPEDPETSLDIARIWGFAGKFEWPMTASEGTVLYSQPIDPTWRVSQFDGVPTPLEYISSMYQFWSGPLEVRLDFVSNAFHTGSLILSAEFGRQCNNLLQASSTYTKVFHLGDQRTVTFVIPYIYDTVWRRTQCVPFCSIQTGLARGNYGYNALLRTMSSMFTVRVVNTLVPVSSVTPIVDVLVFVRGGENFTLHSPIMPNLFNSEMTYILDNFPGSYSVMVSPTALMQFTPSKIEGKTGKELRTFWKTDVIHANWGRDPADMTKERNENEQINTLPIPQELVQEKPEELPTPMSLVDNSKEAQSLKDFQLRYKDYKTAYKYDKYKFEGWNNGNFMFSVTGHITHAASIESETIFDPKLHQWVSFQDFEAGHKWFSNRAMIKFIATLVIPEVQMDQGNEANTDPTITFKQGVKRDQVQTIESHINFKDLLRRPIMIVYQQAVNAFAGGNYFYIPCMPPSHMMGLLSGNQGNRIYVPNIGRSMHVHINDMFRFWRGCQRWTFVISGTTSPVYISYIPHSGCRLVGELTYNNITGTTAPLGGFGLGTEMLVPTINTTHVIETPFDMEDNWALMQEEQASRNYTWRDKGDTNSGHIVLWSTTSFVFDLWWAAGDDFKLSNFIGIPPCINGISQYYLGDNYPVVQMECTATTTISGLLGHLGMSTATTFAGTALPHLGSAYMVGQTCKKAEASLDKMVGVSSELVKQISNLLESLAAKFNWTANIVQWMTNTIFDLTLCFVNRNVTTWAITLLRILGHLFSLSLASIMKYSQTLFDIFSEGLATQANSPKELISGPYWTEGKIGKLLGVVIGIIGLSTGTSYGPPSVGLIAKFTRIFGDFKTFAYMNHVIRFISSIFDLIMDCVKWCCAKTNIEVDAIQQLQNREGLLNDFVTESQALLDESNAHMFGNPAFKLRFWRNTIRAKQIQREIVKLPTNQVSSILSKMCNDVIKKGNEKMCDLRSSPIKYEPFVICITGSTKVGKSTMVRLMVPKILKAMGITDYPSDPVYVRMQSSRFWNGYVDQPIVLVDEWLNITEPSILAEAINELYMLKSCATFIPEQAAIEDKKARASPKVVILLCNTAFPENAISSVAPNKDAVYRRRDVVIQAERKPNYMDTDLRKLSPEDSKKCVHIQASFFASATDPNSLQDEKYDFEALGDKLAELAGQYDKEEIQRVKIQFDTLREQCGANIGSLDEDPFAIFYSNVISTHLQRGTGDLPSDQLESYIDILADRIASSYVVEEEVSSESLVAEAETQGLCDHVKDVCCDAKTKCKEYLNWMKYKFVELFGLPPVAGQCEGCGKTCQAFAACVGKRTKWSNHDDQHILCSYCFEYGKRQTPFDMVTETRQQKFATCPVCERAAYPILPREVSALFYTLQKWHTKKDLRSLIKARIHAIDLRNPITYFLIVQISIILIGGVFEFFIRSTTGQHILVTHRDLRTQMDEPMPSKPRRVIAPSMYGVVGNTIGGMVSYGFNEVGYEKMKGELFEVAGKFTSVPSLTIHGDCIHNTAIDDIYCVRFENKKFILATDEGYMPLPLFACGENCPWRSNEFRMDFCSAYFRAHIEESRKFITELAHNDETKGMLSDMYPLFMLPKWIRDSKPLVTIDERWYERIKLHKVFKVVFGTLGAMVVAFGALKSVAWVYSKLTSLVGIQAPIPSGDSAIRHFKPKIKHMGRSNVSTQSINIEDSVTEKIMNNYISIYAYSPDKKLNRTLTGVGIKQRVAIIPRHYYNWMKSNCEMSFKLGRTHVKEHQIAYIFDEHDFIVSETSDIAIFYMPASTNMFKNISKYIFTDEDYTKKRSSLGLMIKVPKRETNIFTKLELDLKAYKPQCTVAEEGKLKTFHHLIEYNYSEAGACGSLIMCHDHQRPIMAMHVAGSGDGYSGVGFGVLLSQEMLDEIPDDPVTVQAEDIEEPDWLGEIEDAKLHLPLDSNVNVVGSLPPDKVPFTPYTTKIKPSLISDLLPWPSSKEPAILSKKDVRYIHDISPLIAGCAKHGYLTKDFKSSQLEEVKNARWNKLSGLRSVVMQPSKLTFNEAVAGFDHIEYYDTIKLDTSVGWPWCCSNRTLKSSYCSVDKNEDGITTRVVIDKVIINEVKRKDELRKVGVVPLTVFIDTLKDEKKDKVKLRKLGGTRVFCASPFDYTISMRQNFLHFVAAYMTHRHDFNHSVGINVNGSEITRLVRNLLDKGPNIVTIDYSNFGPGFNAGVAANVKHNMIQWTLRNVEGCNLVELSCLLEEGINSVHAMNNLVYRQHGGSPSGSPITVIINSEVNVQYIYLAWLNLSGCLENTWNEFEDNVALFVYGDDLIMSVSNKYIGKFNGITIQAFFREYDIVSTDASKSANVKAYESIYEATFLKKSFDHHPRHRLEWIAKTQLESVYDTPHWIQESVEKREATRINAESCLREAYGHGKEFYERIANKVNQALKLRHIKPVLVTWEELDRQHYPAYY